MGLGSGIDAEVGTCGGTRNAGKQATAQGNCHLQVLLTEVRWCTHGQWETNMTLEGMTVRWKLTADSIFCLHRALTTDVNPAQESHTASLLVFLIDG